MPSEPRRAAPDPRLAGWLLLAVLLLVGGYRAAVIWTTELPLFYDQVQYYHWALDLDWGYYSKPPAVAWLIRATTSLWGDSELAINAGAILAYSATALVVFLIGRDLYDARTGFWAGLVFVLAPIVALNSLFVSTDAPLLLFWALTIWLFKRAVDRGDWVWWIATGLAAGLGLLGKYTMGVLAVGLFVYVATDPVRRAWLRSPRLWVAVAIALLVFSPNLAWNAANGFISFRHTAEISQLDRDLFNPAHLAEFAGAQLLAFGPVSLAVLLWFGLRPSMYRADAERYLLIPAMTMLGVISLVSLLSRAFGNWAAPAYVTAAVFVAAVLLRGRRHRLLAATLALNALMMVTVYHLHAGAALLGIELHARQTPYYRILGWREFGAEVSRLAADYPDAVLLADSRRRLAYLSYYTRPRRDFAWWGPRGGIPGNHYQLVADIADSDADTFLYVDPERIRDADRARFDTTRYLGEAVVHPMPGLTRRAHVYLLRGFRGYADAAGRADGG